MAPAPRPSKVRPSGEGVSPTGHPEDTGREIPGAGVRFGGSGEARARLAAVQEALRGPGPDLLGPPQGRGRARGAGGAGAQGPVQPLRAPRCASSRCQALRDPARGPCCSRSVTAGRLAAGLSRPRGCRELSLRPWRAQAPWTLQAATRSCARCATRSTSARACSTASTTSAPGACAAAPPTVASPARCASECLEAPRDPLLPETGSAWAGIQCRADKAPTPSTDGGEAAPSRNLSARDNARASAHFPSQVN